MVFTALRACVLLLGLGSAVAQCDPAWQPGDPVSMPRGNVWSSTLWDSDGGGPLPSVLAVAGDFVVGSQTAHVATWNGSEWTVIGGGLVGTQTAIAVFNGELVVAGAGAFRRWTGGAWQQFGTYSLPSAGASVAQMLVWNGALYAAGRFDTIAGFAANCIARWSGSSWSPLVGPLGNGLNDAVTSLAVYQNVLYVGGGFTHAGGIASIGLAIWNGTAWVATAGFNSNVTCLAVRIGGSALSSYLFVAGEFTMVGSVAVDRVARYLGATNTWSAMGSLSTLSEPCKALFVRGTGINSYEVVAAQRDRLWLWSGTAWNQLGSQLDPTPATLALQRRIGAVGFYGGRYVVGLEDQFAFLGGVYSFDGAAWQSVDGAGIDRTVNAVLATGSDLVIGGAFRTISGATTNGVAIGEHDDWQPLGGGVTGGGGEVLALAQLPNGDLVAGGSFAVATGGVADGIARWNGSSWLPMGTGTSGPVSALAVLPNGDLVAGGSFTVAGGVPVANLARWNGSAWSNFHGGCGGSVLALLVQPNGDVVVGGLFYTAGSPPISANRIARWSGNAWHAYGLGADGLVSALAAMPDGSLVAGGTFFSMDGVSMLGLARWSGTTWQPLWPSYTSTAFPKVRTLVALPNGDLIAGGSIFRDFGHCLMRLRNGTWADLQVGRSSFESSPDVVRAATVTATGDVVIGGYFTQVTNLVSANVARLAVACPASAVAYGSGCVGSGGLGVLTATTLPWQGSTFRSRATGMPANGVAVLAMGFTPIAVPLAALLPEGLPGCDLLTTLELTAVGVPTAGVFDSEVFLAPSPSLVGVTLYHQVGAVDVAGSSIAAISTTNALALTVGSF